MVRGKRSRIKIPEQTSDRPSDIKRSQASVKRLKSHGGMVSNPNDRSESLYGKGTKKANQPKVTVSAKKNKPVVSSTKKKGKSSGGARAT